MRASVAWAHAPALRRDLALLLLAFVALADGQGSWPSYKHGLYFTDSLLDKLVDKLADRTKSGLHHEDLDSTTLAKSPQGHTSTISHANAKHLVFSPQSQWWLPSAPRVSSPHPSRPPRCSAISHISHSQFPDARESTHASSTWRDVWAPMLPARAWKPMQTAAGAATTAAAAATMATTATRSSLEHQRQETPLWAAEWAEELMAPVNAVTRFMHPINDQRDAIPSWHGRRLMAKKKSSSSSSSSSSDSKPPAKKAKTVPAKASKSSSSSSSSSDKTTTKPPAKKESSSSSSSDSDKPTTKPPAKKKDGSSSSSSSSSDSDKKDKAKGDEAEKEKTAEEPVEEGKERGTVARWNNDKGFGFLTPDTNEEGGEDLFFHISAVDGGPEVAQTLGQGDAVSFVKEHDDRKGKDRATQVKLLGEGTGQPEPKPEVSEADKEDCEGTGIMKKWNSDKGFGFIKPDDGGEDMFCHVSGLADAENEINEGDAISYTRTYDNRKGKFRAINIKKKVDGEEGGGDGEKKEEKKSSSSSSSSSSKKDDKKADEKAKKKESSSSSSSSSS